MTKEVITIEPDAPVLETVRLFKEHKITGLPVIDRDKNLCGIITEKDVLRLLTDKDAPGKKVSDYMTRRVITFKETDSIADVCHFLIKNNVRRVPIVDENNRLVGVISRWDIIMEIMRIQDI